MDENIQSFHARLDKRFCGFDYGQRPQERAQADGKTFACWAAPGLWLDASGAPHIDLDWLLFAFELERTRENIDRVLRFAKTMLKEACPDAEIIERIEY